MQDDFMNRIDAEYREYIADMSELPKNEIIEKASEIAGMTEIYNYFKHGSPHPDQLKYLAQAAHPLQEVYGFYAAYPRSDFERIDLIVYDICDKDLFLNSDIEKVYAERPICFHRKPSSLAELKAFKRDQEADKFIVEKIIELSPEQFLHFTRNLISDSPIIEQNQKSMWHDGSLWHCLLVRGAGVSESVLVESEGYRYARYCAFVPDYSKLDLIGVPVERYAGQVLSREHKPLHRGER